MKLSSTLKAILALIIVSAALPQAVPARSGKPGCPRPWVFFDLGANTLIDTETHDFRKIYYMPGALEYLKDLRDKHYRLGLLVNVPASGPGSWGETPEAKLATTKKFIESAWTDSRPFDWEMFDAGIHFPATDEERKPAPPLFELAAGLARRSGCRAVYQSTLPAEIPAARAAGMIGIRLGEHPWEGQYYYPEAKIKAGVFPGGND